MLGVVFGSWRKTGRVDLEAVEMLVRGSMHQAGAASLGHLLSMSAARNATVPCACGQAARYHDSRPKQCLTVLGRVRLERAYYVCPDCHQGQAPRDAELDVLGTEYSPGVRRMMAAVGSDSSFDCGREQMKLLAGLEVTAKAVERQAESIGADIANCEQAKVNRTVQLELPGILGMGAPVFYVEMDGTQVTMVRSELDGRAGRIAGQPAHTREMKLGCIFTQTTTDKEGRPVRDEASTTYTGAIETAELLAAASTPKPGSAAGAGRRRKLCSAMAPSGSGTSPTSTSSGPYRLSTYGTRASTSGTWPASCFPPTTSSVRVGLRS